MGDTKERGRSNWNTFFGKLKETEAKCVRLRNVVLSVEMKRTTG